VGTLTVRNLTRLIEVDVVATPLLPEVEGGSEGNDVLLFTDVAPEDGRVVAINGGNGDDTLGVVVGVAEMDGGDGNDRLTGAGGDDGLMGGNGDDALYGRDGSDRMLGGRGNDRLFGNAGNDHMGGGDGNDLLAAGVGNDTLVAGEGRDTLRGEAGDDDFVLTYVARAQDDAAIRRTLAYGGEGNDTFGKRDDTYAADNTTMGQVTLHGGAGNDRIQVLEIEGGALYGGSGDDVVYGSLSPEGQGTVDVFGGSGNDTLAGLRGTNVWGGIGDDEITLFGGQMARGEDGNDYLYATTVAGMDGDSVVFYGGSGNDTLLGWMESDTLHGGADNDDVYGGAGNNFLYGGGGADDIQGGRDSDFLSGGEGNDSLTGDRFGTPDAIGADTILGGAGNDTITVYSAGHMLYGGSDDDFLYQEIANEADTRSSTLAGGDGNDVFEVQGRATIATGEGSDRVVLNLTNTFATNALTITDFVRGEDKLDIVVRDGEGGSLLNIGSIIREMSGQGDIGFAGEGEASMTWVWMDEGIQVSFDMDGDMRGEATVFIVGLSELRTEDLYIPT
jgi:Ca2+-binding RTX toxin-like protein